MLVGIAAYFVALRLVLKYQTRPMMRRARITVFSFTLASILVIALLKMGVDWHKIETFKKNGTVTQATSPENSANLICLDSAAQNIWSTTITQTRTATTTRTKITSRTRFGKRWPRAARSRSNIYRAIPPLAR